jgi:hypothetical protein
MTTPQIRPEIWPAPLSCAADHSVALALARRLARPVLQAACGQGLAAEMPVEMAPGATRDRRSVSALEALGRLLAGLAPLLEQQVRAPDTDLAPVAAFQTLLADSVAPNTPRRLNFTEGAQPLVDAAFLAHGILRAPHALWADLPPQVQDHLADALRSTRAIAPHFNNWLLFSAMVEAALFRMGVDWDQMRVDYALRQHQQWYAGDGIYSDGPHLRWDYYNSYVIHPMLDDILEALSGKNKVWDKMHAAHKQRMDRHAVILERMIGADGSFPPIGRSLSYRCGAFQSLAHLALKDRLPSGLSHGQVRAGLMAVIRRTLEGAAHYDPKGWLRIGLNGAQPDLGESYISTGSLYLASTAFLPLGLAKEHPFWNDPATAWTQKRIWEQGESIGADKALDT